MQPPKGKTQPDSDFVTFNKDKDMHAIKKNPIKLPRSRAKV